MANRIFDRRGRQNWDEEKRIAEDRRVRERRSDRDRRQADRRQDKPWPPDLPKVERRKTDRRVQNRRAADNAGASADTPENPPTRPMITMVSEMTLLSAAITELASSEGEVLGVHAETGGVAGVLTAHDVVQALSRHGAAAFDMPLSALISRLRGKTDG